MKVMAKTASTTSSFERTIDTVSGYMGAI